MLNEPLSEEDVRFNQVRNEWTAELANPCSPLPSPDKKRAYLFAVYNNPPSIFTAVWLYVYLTIWHLSCQLFAVLSRSKERPLGSA